MSVLLALETSTHLCSVALLHEGRPLVSIDLQRPRVHAEQLPSLIDEVLRRADRSLDEIEAIALSEGPGSYTGLRIGASTAKGLAESRDLPLVPVSSLTALAQRLVPAGRPSERIVTLRHARAEEYFLASYEIDRDPDQGPIPAPVESVRVVEGHELESALPDPSGTRCWITGATDDLPGSLRTALRPPGGDDRPDGPFERVELRAALLPEGATAPSAQWTGRVGARLLARGEHVEVDTYEPAYGRAFHTRPPGSAVDRLEENS